MSHEPLTEYDNEHNLMCNRCHRQRAEYQGSLADGFPRTILCRECVDVIADAFQVRLSR